MQRWAWTRHLQSSLAARRSARRATTTPLQALVSNGVAASVARVRVLDTSGESESGQGRGAGRIVPFVARPPVSPTRASKV